MELLTKENMVEAIIFLENKLRGLEYKQKVYEENCIDKQRVKDAIEKSFNETTFPTVFMEDDFKERILKELGL